MGSYRIAITPDAWPGAAVARTTKTIPLHPAAAAELNSDG